MTAVLSPANASAKLLDVQAVAELLDCSPRHVYRLSDSGRMPAPLKLGALCRWNRARRRSVDLRRLPGRPQPEGGCADDRRQQTDQGEPRHWRWLADNLDVFPIQRNRNANGWGRRRMLCKGVICNGSQKP